MEEPLPLPPKANFGGSAAPAEGVPEPLDGTPNENLGAPAGVLLLLPAEAGIPNWN